MRDYAKAIQTCLAARAIWAPGASVLPGDYGQIVNGCFVRLGCTSDLGARLRPPEVANEGKYLFSRGLHSRQDVSATTTVEWTGDAIASLTWAGGAGLFLGAAKSSILNITDLGRVVRETLTTGRWGFTWRLVRQVRNLSGGVIALGGNSAAAGRLHFSSETPVQEAGISAEVERSDGFVLVQRGVSGAVYVHAVRLRPWLAHGAAPLDHDLWYDDDLDDD
jgi:hypothetical protein